ncbi:MAG TPA: LemA family protein [Bacteroidia bacterium]|nr:LemA family protein [Bacteroidia bacterium]
MRKLFITIGVIAAAVILFILYLNNVYNGAVSRDEDTKARWADVGASYQRRADLIPNLMNTVKGAAANEKDILSSVTALRSGISTAKTPEDFDMVGKKINAAINLTFEAYPQIRSTENFQTFQAQLEGTENRINRSREDYNESVNQYNSYIRGFITHTVLGIAGGNFEPKKGFEAAAGTEKAPEVKF